MIEVFDDIVTEEEAQEIEDTMVNSWFPFYLGGGGKEYGTGTVGADVVHKHGEDPNVMDHFHFVHAVIHYDIDKQETSINSTADTMCVDLLNKLLRKLDKPNYSIYRCKVNLSPQHKRPPHTYNVPHVDMHRDHMVILYYVTDSDGPTYFFEDDGRTIIKKVEPKRGRFIFFDGNIKHAGSHPIKSKYRIVINYDIGFEDKTTLNITKSGLLESFLAGDGLDDR